jgi:Asp-tRNA(Asn)/Glu-tRNA(Gln) amidotransferase A subunit family amidase
MSDIIRALASGRVTATALIKGYLARIEAYDRYGPKLNYVRELNADALAIAGKLDSAKPSVKRPLAGVPNLVKDDIATGDKQPTTAGSLLNPASQNGLVTVKPTVGLFSRAGILPISHSLDTAGPMTRTVRDAAMLLNVPAAKDPLDPVTQRQRRPADYTADLAHDALKGAHLLGFVGSLHVTTTR